MLVVAVNLLGVDCRCLDITTQNDTGLLCPESEAAGTEWDAAFRQVGPGLRGAHSYSPLPLHADRATGLQKVSNLPTATQSLSCRLGTLPIFQI